MPVEDWASAIGGRVETVADVSLAQLEVEETFHDEFLPINTTEVQKKSLWCWAAVTRQVLISQGIHDITQETIVKDFHNSSDVNDTAPINDAVNMYSELLSPGQKTYRLVRAKVQFESRIMKWALETLDRNWPVPISIRWDTGPVHAVCAFGLRTGPGTMRQLWIYDPSDEDDFTSNRYLVPLHSGFRFNPMFDEESVGAKVLNLSIT